MPIIEGSYATQPRPSDQGEISGQLDTLGALLDSLHGTAGDLRAKLAPLIGPFHDDEAPGLKSIRPEASELACRLMDYNESLTGLLGNLRDTHARLEI
jgi:hypothetical protein